MATDEKKETLSEVIRVFPSDLKRLTAFREGFEEPGRTFARVLDRAEDADKMALRMRKKRLYLRLSVSLAALKEQRDMRRQRSGSRAGCEYHELDRIISFP